ncbi:hypothetical protein HYT17_03555 [Candidatus Microgenomates bacterium]|nr:hypothetical protein [Candidatus Microgenomates bacterium]
MKIKNLKFIILKTSLFFILFIVIGIHSAHAEKLDISLYPPITEIIALASPAGGTPSSTLKAPLILTNNSKKSQTIKFSIKPFTAAQDGSITININDNGNNVAALTSMIRLEKNPSTSSGQGIFTLRPSETANLSLLVDIPKEATPSDYYATLLFQTGNDSEPTSSESGAFSKIEAGIGSNVLLSVRSNLSNLSNTKIKEFSVPVIATGEPVNFLLLLENQGLHFVKVKGDITLADAAGVQIKKLIIPTQNVLAGSIRNISSSAISTQNLWGKYTAVANIDVDGRKTLNQTLTFYVIPKRLLLIGLIGLIGLIAISHRLRFYRKTRRFGRG